MDFEHFVIVGLLLVLAGLLVITWGVLRGAGRMRVEGGGVVVIGPFPVAFGTTRTMAKVMAAVGLALAVLFAVLFLTHL